MKAIILTLCLMLTNQAWALGEDIQPGNPFPQVKLITSMGEVVVKLNRRRAPLTVNNFLHLSAEQEYDNTIFHRVIANFVVQGGGVTPDMKQKESKNQIANESGNGLTNDYGTIAMARQSFPHSASRQFYFNLNKQGNSNLNPNSRGWGYTVFGSVVSGLDVLESISKVNTTTERKLGWRDVPQTKVYLKKVLIIPQY